MISLPGGLFELEDFDLESGECLPFVIFWQKQQQNIKRITTINKIPPAEAPIMTAICDSSFLPPGKPT